AGGRIEISGIQGYANHPGPLVFIANHMSMLDTFALPSLILPFHRISYVIKEDLLDYPVFGAIMRAVNPIAVARKNPRRDLKTVLDVGRKKLADNCSVIIFPQATRSAQFNPAMFNSLGVKLARKAGVPVVPVALKTDFQQNGRLIKEAGVIKPQNTIHIHFGDPIAVAGSGQETHREIVSFIRRHLTNWGAVIPSDPM
ncbi:MAG: 1-acyl-sn-glycerol-3-phosphate acyltransferase, partial [Deltaproteobacteria bacterium]|nr:1-acyl-sn-glycerol-3-phosphate acyltransferase [Deltaproteobacteria bacterium]